MDGMTFQNNLKTMKAKGLKPVAVHSNFICCGDENNTVSDIKVERFKMNGLWLASKSSEGNWNGPCLPFSFPKISD